MIICSKCGSQMIMTGPIMNPRMQCSLCREYDTQIHQHERRPNVAREADQDLPDKAEDENE